MAFGLPPLSLGSILWGLAVRGCIDGFSRRTMFLKCSNNNLLQTVLELFMNAIEKDGPWPSRIRVDHGGGKRIGM